MLLFVFDVIVGPPEQDSQSNAGHSNENANQPRNNVSQVVKKSDQNDWQHQTQNADDGNNLPRLVQITRCLFDESPRANKVVKLFDFFVRRVFAGRNAAMKYPKSVKMI